MRNQQILSKTYSILVLIVLSLSIIALTAELLPEIKAKMIVIPTLILMIILCIFELKGQFLIKR
jgi:hypothetical protein